MVAAKTAEGLQQKKQNAINCYQVGWIEEHKSIATVQKALETECTHEGALLEHEAALASVQDAHGKAFYSIVKHCMPFYINL